MAKYSLYLEDLVTVQAPGQGRAGGPTIACATAQSAYGQASFFSALFTALILGVCVVIAITVSLLVFGVLDLTKGGDKAQSDLLKGAIQGAVGLVGTIVSGSALAFVVTRWNEVKKDQATALRLVAQYCDQQVANTIKV